MQTAFQKRSNVLTQKACMCLLLSDTIRSTEHIIMVNGTWPKFSTSPTKATEVHILECYALHKPEADFFILHFKFTNTPFLHVCGRQFQVLGNIPFSFPSPT